MTTVPGPDDRTQAELLHDLRYGSIDEQAQALERLAAVGEAEALDAVIDFLCDVPEPAAEPTALEALRVLANKYLPLERYALAEALIPFLSAPDWQERLTAVRMFNVYPNELATESVRALVDEAQEQVYFEREDGTANSRMLVERTLGEAIMALANCGQLYVLPEILDLLDDSALRVVAARALGVIGSETERDRLDELCEDRDPRMRDAAQWSLALMDERAEQFMNPPLDPPEPPPDRLNPVYWSHRQLDIEEDDDLLQFLVVRVAIEHLMLDQFLSDGRMPEHCTIVVRRYPGEEPPESSQDSEIVGTWEYSWHGPSLTRRTPAQGRPSGRSSMRGGSVITISYAEDMPFTDTGLVSFDCRFGPFNGQGWLYQVDWRPEGWAFHRMRRTWQR